MSKRSSKHDRASSSKSNTPDAGTHDSKRSKQDKGKSTTHQPGYNVNALTTDASRLTIQATAGPDRSGHQQSGGYLPYQNEDHSQESVYAQQTQLTGYQQPYGAYVQQYGDDQQGTHGGYLPSFANPPPQHTNDSPPAPLMAPLGQPGYIAMAQTKAARMFKTTMPPHLLHSSPSGWALHRCGGEASQATCW